jgi:TolB-like protein
MMPALAILSICAPARTVAISYFDNNTADPSLDPLAKGLADMLITDLSHVESIAIVERSKLNQIIAELELSKSKLIDPKTAQRLGRGLGASMIMTGGYTVAGDTLRIDARVVEVETGRVVASEQVSGKRDEFFSLEKDLVDVLIEALGVSLGRSEKSKLRSNATESFDAWTEYSEGLDAEDDGDAAAARRHFQAALDADPGYRSAKTAIGRLEAIFAKDDREKADRYAGLRKTLDPNAKDFAQRVDALLLQLDGTNRDQLAKKIELLTYLAERDLHPTSLGVSRVPLEALALALRHVNDPTQWENIPKVCEYFIGNYPKEEHPKTYCRTAILKSLEWGMKQDRAAAQRSWDEERRRGLETLAADDWRVALFVNQDGIRNLLALYAKKTER